MNYFELYPGDYLSKTGRLSLLEHGAYLRLLLEYFASEEPLPAEYDELHTICGAKSAADRAAVAKVADRYFPVGDDGQRHNKRGDEEIEKAARRMEGGGEKRANAAERQRRHRDERKHLFEVLRDAGITPDFRTSNAELRAMVTDALRDASRQQSVTSNVDVTRDTTATRSHTPHATTRTDSLRSLGDSEGRALEAPIDDADPDWQAWRGHQQAQRRWSIARERQALGHLRQILADGGDPAAVLRWALSRSLADLLDCHRRMRSDAERDAASDKRPGESLADASARRSVERLGNDDHREGGNTTVLALLTGTSR